ncbi:pentapeptide repeat-containing protein [Streptomyces sp. NBC_00467]|uniref:pentapeptide repeat-containing protein n=1 Tax=Streptomyces sp. NBC_00467 TaxID=2975752 RepID=UPI002E16F1EE
MSPALWAEEADVQAALPLFVLADIATHPRRPPPRPTARFPWASPRWAPLEAADLAYADLRMTDVTAVHLSGATLTEATLPGATLTGGLRPTGAWRNDQGADESGIREQPTVHRAPLHMACRARDTSAAWVRDPSCVIEEDPPPR